MGKKEKTETDRDGKQEMPRKKEKLFFGSVADKEADYNTVLDLGESLAREVKEAAIRAQQEALRKKREQERSTRGEEDEENEE